MPGETEIINMALDLLSEEPIMSPTDDRPTIRWMRRNFQPTMDTLLRMHPWNFAIVRANLPALADAPASGWKRAFQLPPDCVRLLPLNDGCLNGPSITYAVEGRRIMTDAAAPIRIAYIGRPEDLATLDPLFVEVLAATLAAKGGSWITGKQSYAEMAQKRASEALLTAQMVDALESTPADPEADDWLTGRWAGPSPSPRNGGFW